MFPPLTLLALAPLVWVEAVYGHLSTGKFRNAAIVRTIDVGGSTTHVTTSYQFNALNSGENKYYFSLSANDAAKTSWMEAKMKGHQDPLPVHASTLTASSQVHLYHVDLPKGLKADETATLVVSTIQSHASTPLPASVAQAEPQALVYNIGAYVISPYETTIQRTKIRAPNPKILSYDEPKELEKYLGEGETPASKSGATVTYGPFRSIPPSANIAFLKAEQQEVKFHYEYDAPVLAVTKLQRAAEISHWGSNLNIQDCVWLKNDGAALKGHFSRLEHAKQTVMPQTARGNIMRNTVLHLPAGVRDPYFYDIVGNVSTSNFRPAPPGSLSRSPLEQNSILELKPRYPLLGGWNYTFTIGYDMPLEDWVRYDSKQSTYIAGVPFLTPIPGAVYDDVEVKVILPEGANLLEIHPPFPIDVIERKRHITYLDTVGRPMVIFRGNKMTDKHTGMIFVTYTMSSAAHLRKPFIVGLTFFGLFSLGLVLKRIDFTIRRSIHPKKQA